MKSFIYYPVTVTFKGNTFQTTVKESTQNFPSSPADGEVLLLEKDSADHSGLYIHFGSVWTRVLDLPTFFTSMYSGSDIHVHVLEAGVLEITGEGTIYRFAYDFTSQVTVTGSTIELPEESFENDFYCIVGSTSGGGSFTLTAASETELGGIKVGTGLSIDEDGVLSASGGGGSSPYIEPLRVFHSGKPEAGQTIAKRVFTETCKLPVGLTGTRGHISPAPSTSMTFTLFINFSNVGTIVYGNNHSLTITFNTERTLNPGDTLHITAPTPQDANGADIAFTIPFTS